MKSRNSPQNDPTNPFRNDHLDSGSSRGYLDYSPDCLIISLLNPCHRRPYSIDHEQALLFWRLDVLANLSLRGFFNGKIREDKNGSIGSRKKKSQTTEEWKAEKKSCTRESRNLFESRDAASAQQRFVPPH